MIDLMTARERRQLLLHKLKAEQALVVCLQIKADKAIQNLDRARKGCADTEATLDALELEMIKIYDHIHQNNEPQE
jgi:hypothetical protein